MTYAELLARLYGTRRLGVKFELERVRRVLERLGDPAASLGRIAQIGGTNGKGSTAAFVEALLRRAGARTGVFTSPHLSRFAERFRVDGSPAGEAEILAAGERVFAASQDVELTFFEQATAMALVVFDRAGVEVAVLEVGLGGRLDATSAVDADVAAVTGVALDHQQFLGDTLAEIALEKAAIFRVGRPAVVGRCGEPEGVELLVARAEEIGARVIRAPAEPSLECALGLAGDHQRANAACALVIAEQLIELDDVMRAEALAAARCPGRMEVVADAPRTVVDGAHNPQAARVVAAQVEPDTCVIAVTGGKDLDALVAPLVAGVRRVFATEAGADRAVPAAEVAAAARRANSGATVVAEPHPARALDLARAQAGGVVLVAGSLFLAGLARQHLCGDAADPLVLTDPLKILPK